MRSCTSLSYKTPQYKEPPAAAAVARPGTRHADHLMLRSRLAFVAFQQRMDVLKETLDCAAANVPIALS
jgi:hypothetical protein